MEPLPPPAETAPRRIIWRSRCPTAGEIRIGLMTRMSPLLCEAVVDPKAIKMSDAVALMTGAMDSTLLNRPSEEEAASAAD